MRALTEVRTLLRPLSPDELAARERQLERERDALRRAHSARARGRGTVAEVEVARTRCSRVEKVCKAGAEPIEVRCTWRPDLDARRMVLVRDDTHQTVDQRDMTSAEVEAAQRARAPGGAQEKG